MNQQYLNKKKAKTITNRGRHILFKFLKIVLEIQSVICQQKTPLFNKDIFLVKFSCYLVDFFPPLFYVTAGQNCQFPCQCVFR